MVLKHLGKENKNMDSNSNLAKRMRGWVWAKLGEITFIQGGFAFKSKNYKKSGIPLIRISNINNSEVTFDRNTVFLAKDYAETYPTFLVNKNDILVALSGATTGKFGIYKDDKIALLNQRVGRIKFYNRSMIAFRFILYYFDIIRRYILRRAYGAAQPNISTTELEEFQIPLPPLPEQHRIVAKIEELFIKLDAGVEALKKIKTQLKRYHQAVLKYAFEGKLTEEWREKHKDELEPAADLLETIREIKRLTSQGNDKRPPMDKYAFLLKIPNEWSWTNFDEIGEVNPKFNRGEYSHDIDVTFLPMKNVTALAGQVNLSLRKKLSTVVKGYTYFIDGDILFSKITPCMENGKIVIVEKLCNGLGFGSTEFHVIRLSRDLPRKLYFYYLIQEGFRREAKRNMTGAVGQLRVPTNYLKRVPVPFPSLQEQQTIVEEIDRRFSVSDKIEKTVDVSLIQAERLRQSILKQAFEGKLVPQDPKDEPAEKLLERIKAEKAKYDNEKSSVRKWKRKTKQRRLFKNG